MPSRAPQNKPAYPAEVAGPAADLSSAFSTVSQLYRSRSFWRLVTLAALVPLTAFFVLGPGVFLVILGLFMIFVRFAAVHAPSRRLLQTLTGRVDRNYTFKPYEGSSHQKVAFLLPVIFWAGITGLGLAILLQLGFLNQNLLYLLFTV